MEIQSSRSDEAIVVILSDYVTTKTITYHPIIPVLNTTSV